MLSSSNAAGGASPWSRFQKLKTLGAGSFGTVYLCRVIDPDCDDFEDTVAIKTVALEAIGEKEVTLAMSEVAILRNLSHPNVLRFIDCFIDEDHTLCCVTEYVDGGDLAGVIRNAKKQKRVVDAFVVVDMVRQALEGLAFLHSQAVLHRDIKPANIYVTRSGAIKIGDFGVSKLVSDAAPTAVTFIGTPPYICPELFMGEKYSFGADIWALGVTAYELFTLKLPFAASNVLALANIISEGSYDREALRSRSMSDAQQRELVSSCGEAYVLKSEGLCGLVSGLVQAMLVQDPFERPSAHQLLMDFYGVSSSVPDASVYFVEEDDDPDAGGAMDLTPRHGGHDAAEQASTSPTTTSTLSTNGPLPCVAGPTSGNYHHHAEDSSTGPRTSLVARNSAHKHCLSQATIVALSRSLDQRLTQEQRDFSANDDDDNVRVGDGDDEGDDGAVAQQQQQVSAAAAVNHNETQPPRSTWKLGGSFVDPHELERALREKALIYHQKRHAKLRAQREAEAVRREEQQQQQQQQQVSFAQQHTGTGTGTGGSSTSAAAAPFFSRGYLRPFGVPSARPGSAGTAALAMGNGAHHHPLVDDEGHAMGAALLVSDPDVARAVRAIAQSLVVPSSALLQQQQQQQAGSSSYRLPFDPPRVHFSDGDEDDEADARGGEDEDDAKTTPIPTTCTFTLTSTAALPESIPPMRLTIKKVRAGCSLKRLLKRLRTALKAARMKAASPASTPLNQLLLDGDEADDALGGRAASEWQLSLLDADGDHVSFSTQKEWKRLLKAHCNTMNSDNGGVGALYLQSVLTL